MARNSERLDTCTVQRGVIDAMIKVEKLENSFPGADSSTPQMKASALGHAGLDYLKATVFVVENHKHIGPLTNFVLPSMHQTLELLAKAIACKAITIGFDPKTYKHKLLKLLEDHQAQVPIFESMLSDLETVDLLTNLEKSYLGVRYGECVLTYDQDAWRLFLRLAEELLDDLYDRTQIPFLAKHFTPAYFGEDEHGFRRT